MNPLFQLIFIPTIVIFWLIPIITVVMNYGRFDRANLFWIGGLFTYAIGVSVFFSTQYLPSALFYLPSVIYNGALCLFLDSLRQELSNNKTPWGNYAVLVIVSYLLMFITQQYGVDKSIGIPLLGAIQIVLQAYIAAQLMSLYRIYQSKSVFILGLCLGISAIITLIRVICILIGYSKGPLGDFSLIANISIVMYMTSIFFLGFCYNGFITDKTAYSLKKALEGEKEALSREYSILALLKERESLIERLNELQRNSQASALSATLAHEINQPLASIKLDAEYALKNLADQLPPNAQELLQKIVSNTDRSAAIVKTVRQIFQDTNGQPEERKVDEIINGLCSYLENICKKSNIHIFLNLDCDTQIQIGKAELEHILINLVNNAIDSLNQMNTDYKKISIKTSLDKKKARIEVSDNGIGVSPEDSLKLFKLLKTTKTHGQGVGLWLCRYIVERVGGKIFLLEPSKKGATFVVECLTLEGKE